LIYQRDRRGKKLEIPLYPDPGGLLPCLLDFGGGFLCWITEGEPDGWSVMTWYAGTCVIFRGMSVTRLICEWIEQKGRAKSAWPDSYLQPESFELLR
jgi:hypothetical protein